MIGPPVYTAGCPANIRQNPHRPYMHVEDQVLSRFNRVFKGCIRDTHEGVLFRQDINPRAPQDPSPCPNSPDMHTKCFELQMD